MLHIHDDQPTTVPMAYEPRAYEDHKAQRAANAVTDDDDGVQFMGRLLVFAALMTAVAATLVVVML